MEKQKSIIIIGATGSGKSRRAQSEAEKRGEYVVTTWDELQGKFGLAVLGSEPATVIVEGLPVDALKKTSVREYLKHLIDDDYLEIIEKYKHPQMVQAPMFIFTILSSSKPDFSLFSGEWSRFEVVEV